MLGLNPEAERMLAIVVDVAGVAALVLATAAVWVGLRARAAARHLDARYTALMTGVDGESLAAALDAQLERLVSGEGRMADLERQAADLDRRLRRALRRVRLVRYSAFEDSGGDQSFALALLDDEADGVVLSGLYGRSGVRVYAKPVDGGRSTYAMSTEELQVVSEALGEPEVD